jgi:membrane protease YdiL (CAAX protease family)
MNALLLWIFTYGLGEETGWRGFALPRLQEGRSDFSATLILAVFWALWHLPQFFYAFELSFMSTGWLVGLFFGAVFLTWLYNSSSSILIVAVWHGCYNYVTASTAETGILPAALSAVVIFWAIMLLRKYGQKHLISL